jgi:hypothetical protein
VSCMDSKGPTCMRSCCCCCSSIHATESNGPMFLTTPRMCEAFYPPIASLNLVFGPMLKRGDPSRTFSAEARHQIVLSQLLFPTTLLRSYGGLDAQKGVTPDPSSPQWFRIHSAAIVCPFRGLRCRVPSMEMRSRG